MAIPSVEDLRIHCKLEEEGLLECINQDDFNVLAPYLSQWKKVALEFKMSEEIEDIESNNRKEEDKRLSFLKKLKQHDEKNKL